MRNSLADAYGRRGDTRGRWAAKNRPEFVIKMTVKLRKTELIPWA